MKVLYTIIFYISITSVLNAQKKTMTPEVYELWNKIEDVQLSDQGNWVSYRVTNEKGASVAHIYNTRSGEDFEFERVKSMSLDYDEQFAVMKITAHTDSLKALKRKKVKKSDLPKDTLCVFNLRTNRIERIPNVESYSLSKEYGGVVAFKLADRKMKKDSTLVKDENKENGSKLIFKNLKSNKSKVFPFVKKYKWSDKGKLVFHTTGKDSIRNDKVLLYDATRDKIHTVISDEGDYTKFAFNKEESQLAFLGNRDTTDQKEISYELFLSSNKSSAESVVNKSQKFLEEGWKVSENQQPYFLEQSGDLVFGTAPILAQKDSTLLDEEIVNLEIWHYEDGLLHTQQENRKDRDSKKTYLALYDIANKKAIQLADESCPDVRVDAKTTKKHIIGYDNKMYQKFLSWEGTEYYDTYLINLASGQKKLLGSRRASRARLSPTGEYITWYSRSDTSWYSQNVNSLKVYKLTSGTHFDELNDRPMHPRPSGTVAWSDNSESILYDHYDLWKLDITGKKKPKRITKGREQNTRYRYVSLDKEIQVLPTDTTILVEYLNFDDKSSGLAYLNLENGDLNSLVKGAFEYDNIKKSKESDKLIYTKESFDVFPDLILSDIRFSKHKKVSDANPQQGEYNWGSIELYDWRDADGIMRKALIAKPSNFDPQKKYPLLVNFYEKSSDRLHRHRAPYAHRSTINYTYYTNRGYVVFNPDIYYKDGYPGESSYEAIMSSVDQLLEEGYIDEQNMGLQGHSWGGYQIAYILTKTDRFKCAESGAPVVNMISAYGGIRWGSGMSRMFQYERTQSRIGATLWERPDLYIYNSPVFQLDKVNTPVLILHNDKDGAVPWYQGIEYFVGLRRLGKPAWMLNYNDEPHWPVKKQNRLDFNRRMEQFFDHYLKGEPLPVWMKDGIPVLKKGVIDGFEYSSDEAK